MHTGDMYQLKWLPFIDPGSGGSAVAFPRTLARAVAEIKNVDTVIPGHSPVATWADVTEHVQVLEDFVKAAQEGDQGGQKRGGGREVLQDSGPIQGLPARSGRVLLLVDDDLRRSQDVGAIRAPSRQRSERRYSTI